MAGTNLNRIDRICRLFYLLLGGLSYHFIFTLLTSFKDSGDKSVDGSKKRASTNDAGHLQHLEYCVKGELKSLQELSEKYRPSKFGYHPAKGKTYLHTHYQTYYPQWLDAYRNKKFKMLEIGLDSGSGSLLWKEYFPCAEIWGLEFSESAVRTTGARAINIVRGDQGDIEFLSGRFLQETGGNFDLIIDDGGHHFEQQQDSYKSLFSNALNPGGLYVIEDIETSYWKKGEILYSKLISRGGCSNQDTIINRFKNVVDVINKKFYDNSHTIFGSVDHWIQQLAFAQNLIFIQKKSKRDCIHEVQYKWPSRLSTDCPANGKNNFKDQKLDKVLKSFCSLS